MPGDTFILIAVLICIVYLAYSTSKPEMALALYLAVPFAPVLKQHIGFGATRIFLGAVLLSTMYYVFANKNAKSFQFRIDSFFLLNVIFSLYIVLNLAVQDSIFTFYSYDKLEGFFLYSLVPFFVMSVFRGNLFLLDRFVYFYVGGLFLATVITYAIWGNSIQVQGYLSEYGRPSLR